MANSIVANVGGLPSDFEDKLNSVKLSYLVEEPSVKTYRVELYMPIGGTLQTIYFKTASGSCTIDVAIDGTSVTGWSALSVSSTEDSAVSSGSSTWSGGETLTIEVTANTSALDLQITIIGELS